MPTERKVAQVAEIKERMERASVAISADHSGLTVAQLSALRSAIRPAEAELRVVKNTLALRAADEAQRPEMKELLQGPTSFAFGFGDPVAPAKALLDHIREARLNMAIHGGWIEGKVLSAAEVEELAKLPGREQLIANVVGKIVSPLYNFAGLLTATMREFSGLVEARANQLESEGAGS